MKNKLLSTILTVFALLTFLSCKKQEVTINPLSPILKTNVIIDTIKGLEKIGAILKFEQIDDYVDFIEDTNQVKWDKLAQFSSEKGFVNYFHQTPALSIADSSLMDEDFGQLLNVDGVIIIGEKAIKIDKPNESVFLTSIENLSVNYQDLISGDTLNKSIMHFSTNDDIIEYLYFGFLEKCGGSSSFDVTSNRLYRYEDSEDDYVEWNAKYVKLGIYFSVKIYATHTYELAVLPSYSNIKFLLHIDELSPLHSMRFRPRPCSGSNNVYHNGGIRNFQEPVNSSGQTVKLRFKAYERTRSLNGYRLWMKGLFYGAFGADQTDQWIGAEIKQFF